jgi:hypothetical protein
MRVHSVLEWTSRKRAPYLRNEKTDIKGRWTAGVRVAARLPCACSVARVELNNAATRRLRLWNCIVLCVSGRSESVKCCDREMCQSHEGCVNSEQAVKKFAYVLWTWSTEFISQCSVISCEEIP